MPSSSWSPQLPSLGWGPWGTCASNLESYGIDIHSSSYPALPSSPRSSRLSNPRASDTIAAAQPDRDIPRSSTSKKGRKWSSRHREYIRTGHRASCGLLCFVGILCPVEVLVVTLKTEREGKSVRLQLWCRVASRVWWICIACRIESSQVQCL